MSREKSQVWENSSAFRRRWKAKGTTLHLITRERLFQASGPVTENERNIEGKFAIKHCLLLVSDVVEKTSNYRTSRFFSTKTMLRNSTNNDANSPSWMAPRGRTQQSACACHR